MAKPLPNIPIILGTEAKVDQGLLHAMQIAEELAEFLPEGPITKDQYEQYSQKLAEAGIKHGIWPRSIWRREH